ncbi:MAG: aldo/keto reductase [Anaerolineales bacterium]
MKRELGRSGMTVSALGMGCWAIGGPFWDGETPLGWGEVDDDESLQAIERALDLGVTFFDTADVYGAGHSERVLARAFKGRREMVVVATKFGNTFDEGSKQTKGPNADPDYIRMACEDSLRRLETDYIDLYQFHLNDYDAEKGATIRDVLEDLVTEGKIRYYGWSTDFTDRAQVFAEGDHCVAIQHQMNVLDDADPMVDLCEALNLASINRGPLAMGLLTGKYDASSNLAADDVRGKNSPGWMSYFKDGKPNPEWLTRRDAVREVLTSDGRTIAQGALAWLWARTSQSIPIPGFRTVTQTEENCKAMEYGPLSAASMKEIDELLGR